MHREWIPSAARLLLLACVACTLEFEVLNQPVWGQDFVEKLNPPAISLIDFTQVEENSPASGLPEPIVPPIPPGEEQKYGKAPEEPARVQQQFLRSQSVLLQPGQWQLDAGFYYSNSQLDFPAFNGPNLVRADLQRRQFITPINVRYGLTERLQLFANVPLGWRQNELESHPATDPNPFRISNSDRGIGDIVLGANYLWATGCEQRPDVILTISGTLPTGEKSLQPNLLGGGLGNGIGALGAGILFVHTYDPVVVFWGGGYRHYFETNVQGLPYQLGEEISYQMGVGFAANDRVTLSTALLGGYLTDSRINNTALIGSAIDTSRLRFAITVNRNCRIIEPFVEIGVAQRPSTSRVGVIWTF